MINNITDVLYSVVTHTETPQFNFNSITKELLEQSDECLHNSKSQEILVSLIGVAVVKYLADKGDMSPEDAVEHLLEWVYFIKNNEDPIAEIRKHLHDK